MPKSLQEQIDRISAGLEEMDFHVADLQTECAGSFFPAFVIAAALIDAGLISRNRMLELTDTVIDFAASQVPAVGMDEEWLGSLERFRAFLEQVEMSTGTALPRLQLLTSASVLLDILAAKERKRGGSSDEGGAS